MKTLARNIYDKATYSDMEVTEEIRKQEIETIAEELETIKDTILFQYLKMMY